MFYYEYRMSNEYNLYNLEASFRNYLVAENVSPNTLKNYLSDFRYFCGWYESPKTANSTQQFTILSFTSLDDLVKELPNLLQNQVISDYKNYLSKNKLPSKTINRRLSTLRKFCSFCISQGWLKENPAKHLENIKNADVMREKLSLALTKFEEVHPDISKDVREFYSIINL